jgi:hypothetical protein
MDATALAVGGEPRDRRVTELDDANEVGGDDVIALLRSSGYWDSAMDEKLAPVLSAVTRTFRDAYGKGSSVFRSVVAREEGTVIGHVSSLRAYDRTWMTQHLATSPTRHVADLLSIHAGEQLLRTTNLEFFKIWYQHHKTWPARVFGEFARTVTDPRCSDLRAFRHVTMATDAALPPAPAGIEVVEADPGQLEQVAEFLAAREPALVVRADDLDARGLPLEGVSQSFAAAGLSRLRRVLVATRRGVCLGFALGELSSLGLNLYEILSAFRVFLWPAGEAEASAIRMALLGGLGRLYGAARRVTAHGLASSGELLDYQRLGLEIDRETWMCWTFDRKTFEGFRAHIGRLFDRLRLARARRHR